jgi:hypothetical protein
MTTLARCIVEEAHAEDRLLFVSISLVINEEKLTARNVGGRNAIVTTAIVLMAPLSSLAASPNLAIVWLSR